MSNTQVQQSLWQQSLGGGSTGGGGSNDPKLLASESIQSFTISFFFSRSNPRVVPAEGEN